MYVCRLCRCACLERWRENQSFDVLFPFPNTIRSSFPAMNDTQELTTGNGLYLTFCKSCWFSWNV